MSRYRTQDQLAVLSLEATRWSCVLSSRACMAGKTVVGTENSKKFAHQIGSYGFLRVPARLGNPEDTR
jgi:hypothetical protein